jgi:signal peptidase II
LLSFTYVRNAGAAFGMLQGARWPFAVVSFAAAVALTWTLARGRHGRLRACAYAMILAGAVGNLIDRLFYDGLVVDFILMSWRDHHFPVYNVADIGVSVGAALLILSMLRERPHAPDAAPAADPVEPES